MRWPVSAQYEECENHHHDFGARKTLVDFIQRIARRFLAEAVRRGIACLKAAEGHDAYCKIVRNTAGIWKRGDALRYQEEMRSAWGKLS